MRMVRFKKNHSNLGLIFILFIVMMTSLLLNTIGKRVSNQMIDISKIIIKDVIINTINANINGDSLKKYNINDLIKINYRDKKVSDVDYNLENTYDILIDIKSSVMEMIPKYDFSGYSYDVKIFDNFMILEMPFYNYSSNLLLANLGPKISAKINYIRYVNGSVKTKIKTYGINSLQVELYLNIEICSDIVVPFINKENITSMDILISSKIIQGEIPSIYNGLYESESKIVKTN